MEIEFYSPTLKELQKIEEEIKHTNNLHHPFIVKIIDDFIDSEGH